MRRPGVIEGPARNASVNFRVLMGSSRQVRCEFPINCRRIFKNPLKEPYELITSHENSLPVRQHKAAHNRTADLTRATLSAAPQCEDR